MLNRRRCTLGLMADHYEKQAEEWLESIIARNACNWCRFRDRTVYSDHLCRSCYDIRAELRRLHRQVVAAQNKYGENFESRNNRLLTLELDYRTVIEMADAAQVMGREYEGYLQHIEPLDCEWQFRSLSRRFIKRDIFDHYVFLFQKLSPINRRYVIYLIGRLMQTFYSQNRRKLAAFDAGKSLVEVLASRAQGTYRVEDDAKALKPPRKRSAPR
jgi:hypothetical protein